MEQINPGDLDERERGERLTSIGLTYRMMREIRMFRKQYQMEHGQEPSDLEVEAHLKSLLPKRRAGDTLPLVAEMAGRDSFELVPIDISQYEVEGPDTTQELVLMMAEHENRRQRVFSALEALTEKQRIVIIERYGLNGEPKTLQQVGQILGITANAVMILERRGLRNFRIRYKLLFGEIPDF